LLVNDSTPFALFVVAAPLAVFGSGALLGLLGRWLTRPSKRDRDWSGRRSDRG